MGCGRWPALSARWPRSLHVCSGQRSTRFRKPNSKRERFIFPVYGCWRPRKLFRRINRDFGSHIRTSGQRGNVGTATPVWDRAVNRTEGWARKAVNAGFGHRHAATVALKKTKAQAGFESFDRVAERGG